MPLPSPYVPSFVSRLILGSVVVLHALMLLMQHWSVGFKCWLKYPHAELNTATHVKVRRLMKEHHPFSCLHPFTLAFCISPLLTLFFGSLSLLLYILFSFTFCALPRPCPRHTKARQPWRLYSATSLAMSSSNSRRSSLCTTD